MRAKAAHVFGEGRPTLADKCLLRFSHESLGILCSSIYIYDICKCNVCIYIYIYTQTVYTHAHTKFVACHGSTCKW